MTWTSNQQERVIVSNQGRKMKRLSKRRRSSYSEGKESEEARKGRVGRKKKSQVQ